MPVVGTPVTSTPVESRTESEVLDAARLEIGNVPTAAAVDIGIKDEALRASMRPLVRELNRVFGTGSSKKEKTFNAVAGTQDYAVSSYVSADVGEIVDVSRSDMYLPDLSYGASYTTDVNGRPVGQGVIPDGFQAEAMNVIRGIKRADFLKDFDWELAYPNGVESIRLYPIPDSSETIVYVQYTTTGTSIETLPDDADDALHYAACTCLLNCMLNRLNSTPSLLSENKEAMYTQLKALTDQRNRYEGLYEAAKNRNRGA
jgi:hypothetical protein